MKPTTHDPASRCVDWAVVRAEFRLDPSLIHLTHFLLASPPRQVREAADRWRAVLDRDPSLVEDLLLGSMSSLGTAGHGPYQYAKNAMADYLGAAPDEVALMPSTTAALALVYHGLSLRAGQELLLTTDAHYSHLESARRAAEKRDSTVRTVRLARNAASATVDEILASVQAAITSHTRVLGVTWVSSCTGLKLPLTAIAGIVAEANRDREPADRCLLVVDGVHGFGVEDVDATRLGADFFAAGAHKWFLGPAGTGILWGRPNAWTALSPTIPSFDFDTALHRRWLDGGALPPTKAAYLSPGGFADYANVFALTEAAAFHRQLSRPVIAARVHELNTRLRDGLADLPGLRLLTPRSPLLAGGIVCVQPKNHSVEYVVRTLRGLGITSAASPYQTPAVRLGAGVANTPEEIDRAVRALADIH
ncbi:aminotransferase class V-fold PLP-dependent enzyme [Fodinicola feengrottensis]|uniref:Aminotransferase class V-fold PLP-dependent enzyme n=1 Tax=Fodinicola feengrottensis TaxID=435914 RepID=A0ABN2G1F2_9ACTN